MYTIAKAGKEFGINNHMIKALCIVNYVDHAYNHTRYLITDKGMRQLGDFQALFAIEKAKRKNGK
jgi:hypothetical protein